MSEFRADCSECCGLCCIVPAQFALQGFGEDKPEDTPCRHLDASHRCRIYARRSARGYSACEGFDCFGAGQWVTKELFAGADWKSSAEVAKEMFAAYRLWAPRFRAAATIEAALPHVRDDARDRLVGRMNELVSKSSGSSIEAADEPRLHRETLRLIREALRQDD